VADIIVQYDIQFRISETLTQCNANCVVILLLYLELLEYLVDGDEHGSLDY
jgi:hypothetical protein